MENKRKTLYGNAMYIALFVGGANILIALLFWAINLSSTSIGQYLTYIILLAGIILGTISYRNNQLGGYITYGKAFNSGLLISVFTSIILGFFAYLLFKFIDPEIMNKIKEMGIENMTASNPQMTDEQIEMATSFYTPGWMAFFAIIGNILVGLILSLIAAIFIKKVDNSFESNFKDIQ
ncbi:MAG: DUF4199 domain-containing protein [Bacteroidota bacterium]